MNKKIAIFTTDLYKGGVSESTRKLVNHLSRDNHVDLIVYDNTPVLMETLANRVIKLNLPLAANFAKSDFGRLLKKIFRVPGLFVAILYLLIYRIKNKPDVIYSMMYIPNVVNILASKIIPSSTKIIISERQDPRMDLVADSSIARILKMVYPHCDRIHANSLGMISAIEEFYSIDKSKIYHLDNFFDFIDVARKSNESINSNLDEVFKHKVIITSGRLSKQKGHWHLLYAFSHLVKINSSYRLIILGDGELESYYKGLINSLGLMDYVYMFGNVSNPHKFIRNADLFIFPSIWESFGNSLVEAMSLGLPVISTSCKSGPDYIIDNGRYGYNLNVLTKFDFSENKKISETIINAILFFEDEKNYEKFSNLSLLRSYDFCEIKLNSKINSLFSF